MLWALASTVVSSPPGQAQLHLGALGVLVTDLPEGGRPHRTMTVVVSAQKRRYQHSARSAPQSKGTADILVKPVSEYASTRITTAYMYAFASPSIPTVHMSGWPA